jgi:RraA family protein
MELLTTDLCDAHEDKVRVVEPMFNSFGGRASFFGRIATLKLFEDNSLVRKALESAGEGRVLVIDGGGSLRRALVGRPIGGARCQERMGGYCCLWLHPRFPRHRRHGHRRIRD